MGIRYGLHFGSCLVAVFSLFSIQILSAQNLEKLLQAREIAIQNLHRIQNGASPCTSTECQNKKAEILYKLQNHLHRMRWSQPEPIVLNAAYSLTRDPSPELSFEPKGVKDWMDWWKLRHSKKLERDAQWMKSFENIVSRQKTFESLLALIPNDPFTLDRLKDFWSPTFREACVVLRNSVLAEAESQQLELIGDLVRAQKKSAEAEKFRSQLKNFEAELNRPVASILKEIFPDKSGAESLDMIVQLHQWSQTLHVEELEDERLQDFIESSSRKWREIFRMAQSWTDLEYGIVGLDNFEGNVNPAVRAYRELEIQKRLDRIELIGQSVIDFAQYSFVLAGVREFALGSKLMSFFGLFASGYAFEKFELRMGKKIIPSSNRSLDLMNQIPTLEERMATRKNTLIAAKKIFEARLEEIESKIDQLKELKGGNNEE